MTEVSKLAAGIQDGDRRALAQAITLVESSRPEDTTATQELIQVLLARTGNALRVGVSGVPGAGKSTFIDELGTRLVDEDHRVAVLAVDPSSIVSGGSIMGDKTRMQRLGASDQAFIRPSPSGRTLGGVARRTREAMLLCEAAGYDVVLVETVGVGQAEVAVANMVDCFMVMLLAGAGDELQGIKRGIMELADIVLIHKSDGDNRESAMRSRQEFETALRILHGGAGDSWQPPVLCASSLTGDGIQEVWKAIEDFFDQLGTEGRDKVRRQQALHWFDDALQDLMRRRLLEDESIASRLPKLRAQVQDGKIQPLAAAQKVLG